MNAAVKRLDVICIGRVAVDLYAQQIGARLEDVASFSKMGGTALVFFCCSAYVLTTRKDMSFLGVFHQLSVRIAQSLVDAEFSSPPCEHRLDHHIKHQHHQKHGSRDNEGCHHACGIGNAVHIGHKEPSVVFNPVYLIIVRITA